MNKYLFKLAICITLLLMSITPAKSQSEWQLLNTFKLTDQPIDLLVSGDKRLIYILNDRGQLLIYKSNGHHKDTIEVGKDVVQIKAGPSPDILYLLSRNSSNVQMVRILIVEEIDTLKAPVLGKAKAPVSVVVFSDFQ